MIDYFIGIIVFKSQTTNDGDFSSLMSVLTLLSYFIPQTNLTLQEGYQEIKKFNRSYLILSTNVQTEWSDLIGPSTEHLLDPFETIKGRECVGDRVKGCDSRHHPLESLSLVVLNLTRDTENLFDIHVLHNSIHTATIESIASNHCIFLLFYAQTKR